MRAMIRALEALRIAGEHEGVGAHPDAVTARAADYVDFVRDMEDEEVMDRWGGHLGDGEPEIVGTAVEGPDVDEDVARDPAVQAVMQEVDEAMEAAGEVIGRVERKLRKKRLN